jgi:hypothetical protein
MESKKKTYCVTGTLYGDDFEVRKEFPTREAANRKAFSIIERNGLQLQDEMDYSKHVHEFYCGNRCALWVSRVVRQ